MDKGNGIANGNNMIFFFSRREGYYPHRMPIPEAQVKYVLGRCKPYRFVILQLIYSLIKIRFTVLSNLDYTHHSRKMLVMKREKGITRQQRLRANWEFESEIMFLEYSKI